jgi:hypothetical protein
MNLSLVSGLSFGLTSGVITTLGVIGEHLAVAGVVVAVTHFVGDWVRLAFQ